MKKMFVVGSAIAAVGTAALVAVIKNRSKTSPNEIEIDHNRQMEAIQAHHDAEMAALKEEELKNEKGHQERVDAIHSLHDKKISKMEEIREELIKNIELRKGATPEEALKLEERYIELLKKLHEIPN